jgi:hypothetical protein
MQTFLHSKNCENSQGAVFVMIILRHGTEVFGSRPQRTIADYFANNGAKSIVEMSSKPEETRYYKGKFEFPDAKVNTWEEIEEERDGFNKFIFTYSGRIVLNGPGEKARAKAILERFGNKIVGIKNFTPQKTTETPQQ